MGKRLGFKGFARGALAASATAALLAAALPANQALAAGMSAECHGVVGGTTDATDLPNGNLKETMSFIKGPAVSTAKSTKQVSGSFNLTVDVACKGFGATASQTPCVQAGSFAGSIAKGTGNMTLAFADPPSSPAGSGLLAGCSMTYSVAPVAGNTGAVFIPTGPLTGSCKPANTRLVMSCTETN